MWEKISEINTSVLIKILFLMSIIAVAMIEKPFENTSYRY